MKIKDTLLMAIFIEIILTSGGILLSLPAQTAFCEESQTDDSVVPVDWDSFPPCELEDDDAILMQNCLRNASRYIVTTWYNEKKNYDSQTGDYLNFGGNTELDIRPSAAMAFALATALKTGVYDPNDSGVSTGDATAIAVRLIKSLAYHHLANDCGIEEWGNGKYTALWAAMPGAAGWFLWNDLSPTNQEYVRKMVEYECNRFSYTSPPYWNGVGGDTKAEENAFNSLIMQLAALMMPNHSNHDIWMKKCVEYMISAYSRPYDNLYNTTVYHGKPISEWLDGYNCYADGMVKNHNYIHPEYTACIIHNMSAGILFSLARKPTPQAAFFNADVVYHCFVDKNWPSPPYQQPGGPIYTENSHIIYCPDGTDKSQYRKAVYACLDAFVSVFGCDHLASVPGSEWIDHHGGIVYEMQQRHSDGHCYAEGEDGGKNAEHWVAQLVAWAYLAYWVDAQNAVEITNEEYPAPVRIIVNDDDGRIIYCGSWTDNNSATGRIRDDQHYSNTTGDCLEFTFTGLRIEFVAGKSFNRGKADIFIDDIYECTLDLYSASAKHQQAVYAKNWETTSEHTIKIAVTGEKNPDSGGSYISVDALAYYLPEELIPDISLPIVVNDDDPLILYNGSWTANASAAHRINEDEHYSNTPGDYIEFAFTGYQIDFITTVSANRGKAQVYMDGAYECTLDLYAQNPNHQQVVYSKYWETSGDHAIKIIATGEKNPNASAAYVVLDAFSYTQTPAPAIVNDDNGYITYSGTWTDNNYASERVNNDEHYSNAVGDYLEFTFTGPKIDCFSTKSPIRGKMDIYIDGIYEDTVDLYAQTPVHQIVYSKRWEACGTHKIKLLVAGKKNINASDYYVSFDAFRYIPETQEVSSSVRVNDDDCNIVYSGTWKDNHYAAGNIRYDSHSSHTAGDYFEFTFTGSKLDYIATVSNKRGKADIFIDGIYDCTIDLYAKRPNHQQVVYSKYWEASGEHTVKVVVSGEKNPAVHGVAYVALDAFYYRPAETQETPAPIIVNDDDSSVVYNGIWTDNPEAARRINNDEHYSNTPCDYVEFTFNGSKIDCLTTVSFNRGKADIYLDGIYDCTVDLYSFVPNHRQVFYSHCWDISGEHTIKIAVTGEKNPASSGTYLVIDAFRYTQ